MLRLVKPNLGKRLAPDEADQISSTVSVGLCAYEVYYIQVA